MRVDKDDRAFQRIPIHFAEEDAAPTLTAKNDKQDAGGGKPSDAGGGLSSEEIGRASIYEDETEVQRRIDRGAEQDTEEGRERANDNDTAGSLPTSELPENRDDQTKSAPTAPNQQASAPSSDAPASVNPSTVNSNTAAPEATAAPTAGPLLAELIATRAELKRLEAEQANWQTERANLNEKLLDAQDKLARRQADFENYRKRIERDRSDAQHRMIGDVVSKLLPVLDNMRRAVEAEESVQVSESKEFKHFLHGVELIAKQLSEALESLGLRPVQALGERFDPHLHEAVATEQTNDYEPDTVMQELMRGYLLGEKLLRPAMVKVSTR